MTCYHPLSAYRYGKFNPVTGKWSPTFKKSEAHFFGDPAKDYIDLPCGQCVGCRLERSRQWAIRCVNEAQMWPENCFITLTFDNQHISEQLGFPDDFGLWSLDVVPFQKFMKRLRKKFGDGIRFFHCGEYGELTNRPHYHAILFNIDFPDKYLWNVSNGFRLYRSPILEKLWPFGNSLIGDVTFESAAYVARYVMKKVNGNLAEEHYHGRKPEYITMSRRHGIGYDWFMKYRTDVYPHDYVVVRDGLKCRPPRFYDKIFDIIDPEMMYEIKCRRAHEAQLHEHNNIPSRLEVREKCKIAQLNKLKRGL